MKTFLKFSFAGFFGFLADYASFLLLSSVVSIHIARPMSFVVAAHVTYFINRSLAFKGKQARYFLYLMGQVKGFLIGVAVFEGMLLLLDNNPYGPHIAFMTASPFVLLFNYSYSKYLAFR